MSCLRGGEQRYSAILMKSRVPFRQRRSSSWSSPVVSQRQVGFVPGVAGKTLHFAFVSVIPKTLKLCLEMKVRNMSFLG